MTTNLLGLAATCCVVGATAGLAGPLWALLLLGVALAAMCWVSHTQDDLERTIAAAVAKAVAEQARLDLRDKQQALAEAAQAAAYQLDSTVAEERAKTAAPANGMFRTPLDLDRPDPTMRTHSVGLLG